MRQPPLVVGPSLFYFGGATAEVQVDRAPQWLIDAGLPTGGITSSVDNGVADFDVWTVANLPDGIDDQATWDGCVAQTKSIVINSVAAMHPRFFNPSLGERPLVDDPMVVFGD